VEPRPSSDLVLVDCLLRLQLQARREGCPLRLTAVPAELRELIDFCGVADVLGLEPRRETELREELGVDEVVQPGDPAVRGLDHDDRPPLEDA
jgi:hypothetical protein